MKRKREKNFWLIVVISIVAVIVLTYFVGSTYGDAIKMSIAKKMLVTKLTPTPMLKEVNNINPEPVIYEMTIDKKSWDIIKMRYYPMDKGTKKVLDDYNSISDKIKFKGKYTAGFTIGKEVISVPFSIFDIKIVEDFGEKEIKLIDFKDDIPKEQIVIRVIMQPLSGKDFILDIIDERGKKVKTSKYSVKANGKDSSKLTLVKADKTELPMESSTNEAWTSIDAISGLKNILPNHNKLGENRFNIIFVGVGFQNGLNVEEYLPSLIDLSGQGITVSTDPYSAVQKSYGLLGEEPFKSNKNLFNFWYADSDAALGITSDGGGCYVNAAPPTYYGEFSNVEVVYLMNINCRSNAVFDGGATYLSFLSQEFMVGSETVHLSPAESLPGDTRTFVHEMGHAIGSLADEYVEEGKGTRARYPNCAPDEATARIWGWQSPPKTGCSYSNSNVRPTENSIMRQQNYENHFNVISKRHLCYIFAERTGKTARC